VSFKRIYLSPPHLSGEELRMVEQALAGNWIAPVGPDLDAFEKEFCALSGSAHAVALCSGTAALHLSMLLLDIGPGDEVLCSDLTFAASANAITYVGATPVFIDSEPASWNMDVRLLEEALEKKNRVGKQPKAVVAVHLYGQSADLDPILAACRRYGVDLIEDAAESLGATYKGSQTGTLGRLGVFSFNGNKIITTSGGGMLVSSESELIGRARFLATQAREPGPHYEHSCIGFNYRLSNILAALGRAQLRVLYERVETKRRIYNFYSECLADLPGIEFMPDAPWGRSTRWLTCITVNPERFGADRETIRLALEEENIESRPVWKPMHLQPVYKGREVFGGGVSERIFERGLCLPSGTSLTDTDLQRIVDVVRKCCRS
jgi:dTDP-4-amino-4,6-dideoxygalactose transaminase